MSKKTLLLSVNVRSVYLGLHTISNWWYRVFSNDVTATLLVFQTNPVGVELFSYVSAFFVPIMVTWVKTLYKPAIFVFIYFKTMSSDLAWGRSRPFSSVQTSSSNWAVNSMVQHVFALTCKLCVAFFIPSTALTRLTLARGHQSCLEVTKAGKLRFKNWMSVIVKSWLPRKS